MHFMRFRQKLTQETVWKIKELKKVDNTFDNTLVEKYAWKQRYFLLM